MNGGRGTGWGHEVALLSLCDVSKTYWRGRHPIRVLDRVSLDVEPGQFVAVNASARAGKTTLLRVAAGLERPDEGAVLFDGRDLALPRSRRWWSPSPHVRALHPRMAWVRRAGPSSKSTPMLRYVALALLDEYRAREADRRASALLQELGVDDLARATWRELSDSERTLMTIAHAIARRPALLFADNLTDGLGLNERETVLALLRHRVESAGMAILLAAETVPATLRADTITTLSNGQLIKPTQPPAADVVPLRRDAR